MSRLDGEYDELVGRALQAAADLAEPAADGLERIRARLETPYPRPVAWMLTRFPVAASFVLSRLMSLWTWPQALLGSAGGRLRMPWAAGPPARRGPAEIVMPLDELAGWPFGEPDEISADAVPPAWLPDPGWRSSSPGEKKARRRPGARWPRWVAPAACAALVAGVAAVPVALSNIVHRPPAPSWPEQAVTPASADAAAWVAAQVRRSAAVACDPAMCLALSARGFPRGQLRQLRLAGAYPLHSTVIVATPAVRRTEFGRHLTSYAPAVIASFGSGGAQIDVRVTAPYGPAAYWSALRADLRSRKEAGRAILDSLQFAASSAARRDLLAGRVDSALLVAITNIATHQPVFIVAFGDSGPGAGAGAPLRSVELAENGRAAGMSSAPYVRAMIGQLKAQLPPYLPAQIGTLVRPGGERVLRVQFDAPSPLGLAGFGSMSS